MCGPGNDRSIHVQDKAPILASNDGEASKDLQKKGEEAEKAAVHTTEAAKPQPYHHRN